MNFPKEIESLSLNYKDKVLNGDEIKEAKLLLNDSGVLSSIMEYKKILEKILFDETYSEISKFDEKDYFLVFGLYNHLLKLINNKKIERDLKKDEKEEKKNIIEQKWFIDEFMESLDKKHIESENKRIFLYNKLDRYGLELLYKKLYIGNKIKKNWLSSRTWAIDIDILKDALYWLFFNNQEYLIDKITWRKSFWKSLTIQSLEYIDFDIYIKFKSFILIQRAPSWYTKEEKTYSKHLFEYIKLYKNENLDEDIEVWFKKFVKNWKGIMLQSY